MNRALFALLIAFVAAGIVGGFMVVGGPGYARMEKNDAQRASDLRVLGDYYRCKEAVVTEDDGVSRRYCRGQRIDPEVNDPVTGAAYSYMQSSDTSFEVCATFETDAQKPRSGGNRQFYFEGQEGCLRYSRTSAQDDWVKQ